MILYASLYQDFLRSLPSVSQAAKLFEKFETSILLYLYFKEERFVFFDFCMHLIYAKILIEKFFHQ